MAKTLKIEAASTAYLSQRLEVFLTGKGATLSMGGRTMQLTARELENLCAVREAFQRQAGAHLEAVA